MKVRNIISALLILFTILAFSACQQSPVVESLPPTTTENPTKPLADATKVYNAASSNTLQIKDFTQTIHLSEKMMIQQECYSKETSETFRVTDYGLDTMTVLQEQSNTFGSHTVDVQSSYTNGILYIDISGGKYYCEMAPQDYLVSVMPAVILDASLYATVEGTTDGTSSLIHFSQPQKIESWAAPADAEMIEAYGNVLIDGNNMLQECTYHLKYNHSDTSVEKTINVIYDTSKPTITLPEFTGYSPINAPQAPVILEQAAAYLLQAGCVTSETIETISCNAYNEAIDTRVQTTTLNTENQANKYGAKLDINTQVSNTGRGDEKTKSLQSILYVDGKYTTTIGNDTPIEETNVSQEQMQIYCHDYLLRTILLTENITSYTVTEEDNLYRITFAADEDLAKNMRLNVCETLYSDATFLEELSSSYATTEMSGYIVINKSTGIPVASGIKYSGTYEISSYPYYVSYQADQTYTIPSDTAHDSIYMK